ncbi:MAG TPA: DegT/DnrJ/EryC1/StrS family aminotransferase [Candidatus Acidoferrum sp.]|jgi:dTDP-4-amino-4,6-dideoxygalactose transaminase|nr:DegT/DnrJ/EryC1/StrS family aminotransferase [Candidatus Acidoferrum sp.]
MSVVDRVGAEIGAGRPVFSKLLPIVDPEGVPGEEFLEEVREILASKQLTNGAYVRKFEEAAAEYLGVAHCVAVSSCTAGLLLVLKVSDLSGEVILPSFTFHATAHAVVWNGLTPVFADCDAKTFCIAPEAVRAQVSSRTVAILAVHLFGNPAAIEELEEIAAGSRIPLVFDAAHAFGSSRQSKRLGGFGTAEVFSFSPTKLVVAGEGGLVTTRDTRLAERLRAARNYGDAGNYNPEVLGVNARMSEINAAMALHGLMGLDARIERRNEIRLRYERKLRDVAGIRFQEVSEGGRSTFKDFSVIVDEKEFGHSRDWLVEVLHRENIGARKYFSPPVHRQKLYSAMWDGRALPVTDLVSDGVVSLPIYSSLSDDSVDKVCEVIWRAQGLDNTKRARRATGAA